jgi:membrane protease YdiL (CAAX protease family)
MRYAGLLAWLSGFLLLDLYANFVPRWVGYALPVWLAYAVGFFVLAFVVCRFALGLRSTADVGLGRGKGWMRQLAFGFLVGFGVWAFKNVVFAAMGKFELVGWRDAGYALPLLAQALVGMFLASAINDLMIRGYGLAFCRRFQLMAWYVLVTSVVYALDDSWNEGIQFNNLVFSLVLGVSLAYTVVKTGAIWMSIGIHWGGNTCFRVMSGFDGNGIARLEHVVDGVRFEYAGILVTALMFPLLVLAFRYFDARAQRRSTSPVLSP